MQLPSIQLQLIALESHFDSNLVQQSKLTQREKLEANFFILQIITAEE